MLPLRWKVRLKEIREGKIDAEGAIRLLSLEIGKIDGVGKVYFIDRDSNMIYPERSSKDCSEVLRKLNEIRIFSLETSSMINYGNINTVMVDTDKATVVVAFLDNGYLIVVVNRIADVDNFYRNLEKLLREYIDNINKAKGAGIKY